MSANPARQTQSSIRKQAAPRPVEAARPKPAAPSKDAVKPVKKTTEEKDRADPVKPPAAQPGSKTAPGPKAPSTRVPAAIAGPSVVSAPSAARQGSGPVTATKTSSAARKRIPSSSATKPAPPLRTSGPTSTTSRPIATEKAVAPTEDLLQLAAQVYAWVYMQSTLTSTAQAASASAEKTLADWKEKLDAEEKEIADDVLRDRLEWEIKVLDDLAHINVADKVPAVFSKFLSSQAEYTKLVEEAMRLPRFEIVPGKPVRSRASEFTSLLSKLSALQRELTKLTTDLRAVAELISADSAVRLTLEGLAEVTAQNVSNVRMCRELVELRREDERGTLEAASLELSLGQG